MDTPLHINSFPFSASIFTLQTSLNGFPTPYSCIISSQCLSNYPLNDSSFKPTMFALALPLFHYNIDADGRLANPAALSPSPQPSRLIHRPPPPPPLGMVHQSQHP